MRIKSTTTKRTIVASNSVSFLFLSVAARHPLFNFHEFQFKTMSFVFTVLLHFVQLLFAVHSNMELCGRWGCWHTVRVESWKNRKSLYERIHHHHHYYVLDNSISIYLPVIRVAVAHTPPIPFHDFCFVAGFVYTAKLTIFYSLNNTYECQCIGGGVNTVRSAKKKKKTDELALTQ